MLCSCVLSEVCGEFLCRQREYLVVEEMPPPSTALDKYHSRFPPSSRRPDTVRPPRAGREQTRRITYDRKRVEDNTSYGYFPPAVFAGSNH